MANDVRRKGLWGKLTSGLFEFDAPLTANLLPLLPDKVSRGRRRRGPVDAGAEEVADEGLEIEVEEVEAEAEVDDRERAALVVVHGHAPGERFDLEEGAVTLGPEDEAVLICDEEGVTLRAQGPAAEVHVDFRRVEEVRLEHGALVTIGGTFLKFLRCRDLEAAHFEELWRLHRFDGVSDVHHERYLRRRLWSELSHARRHAGALALVILDLEPRTARGGAITGPAHERVVGEVARAARRATREGEVLARLGFSQLALVLPGHDLAAATARAESLRAAVAAATIVLEGQRVMVAPTAGVAALERAMLVHDDLVRAALAALPARA